MQAYNTWYNKTKGKHIIKKVIETICFELVDVCSYLSLVWLRLFVLLYWYVAFRCGKMLFMDRQIDVVIDFKLYVQYAIKFIIVSLIIHKYFTVHIGFVLFLSFYYYTSSHSFISSFSNFM